METTSLLFPDPTPTPLATTVPPTNVDPIQEHLSVIIGVPVGVGLAVLLVLACVLWMVCSAWCEQRKERAATQSTHMGRTSEPPSEGHSFRPEPEALSSAGAGAAPNTHPQQNESTL